MVTAVWWAGWDLAPILAHNEVRQLIVDGDRAFVLYDFVTDTPVGPVLCGELLTVEEGLIHSSTLIFDWRRWPEVLQELQARIGSMPPQQATGSDPVTGAHEKPSAFSN